jgi:putative heme transporter
MTMDPMTATRATRIRRAVLVLATVAVAVWAGRRLSAAGASWSVAWRSIFGVSGAWLVVLAVVWLAGQAVYTIALAASMPGLSRRRALTLSLSGSAITNLLPFGTIAATAVSLVMVRAWGHDTVEFVRYVVVSKACDLVTKLTLPAVVVAGLFLSGVLTPGAAASWFAAAVAAAVIGGLVTAGLVGRATPLLRLVRWAEHLWRAARRAGPGTRWTAAAASTLDATGRLVRRRWPELVAGTGGYWLLQGVLLGLCLAAVGAAAPASVVLAGLLVERTMTLVAFTPGGAGLVEVGTTGALIALGADPTGALAGVLLFRAFVFAAEIPLGGATLAGWLLTRRAVRRVR